MKHIYHNLMRHSKDILNAISSSQQRMGEEERIPRLFSLLAFPRKLRPSIRRGAIFISAFLSSNVKETDLCLKHSFLQIKAIISISTELQGTS